MSNYNSAVVGITETNGKEVYKVIGINYQTMEISKHLNSEDMIVSAIKSGKARLLNAEVNANGKITGRGASLNRFKDNKIKPLVVLQKVKRYDGTVIGYVFANSDGQVTKIRADNFLERCLQIRAKCGENTIPVQNMQLVFEGGKEYLREYAGVPIPETVLEQKKVGAAPIKEAPIKEKSKAEELFTPEQLVEIRAGMKSGVDVKVYGNPKMQATKMKVLREALERGTKVEAIADYRYSLEALQTLVMDIEGGMDVTYYANPEFNISQMGQILTGLNSGVDASVFAIAGYSAEEMYQMRLRMEAGLWEDKSLGEDVSWKRGW